MKRAIFLIPALILSCLTLAPIGANARAEFDIDGKDYGPGGSSAGAPAFCRAAHRVGKIVLGINNNGTFGTGFGAGGSQDCFTGQGVPSCEYPKNSSVEYLFAASFWIGAVVGRDTLVSFGADGWNPGREMFPDESPFGDMIKRSIIDPTKPEYKGAVSEEDYIATYSDTYTQGVAPDVVSRLPHRPIFVKITEASYAWSYSYAEDIVLFDYKITNIGTKKIENAYMGIYVDADVCFSCSENNGFADDICGFVHSVPAYCKNCEYEDEVNIAWIADNDGDFNQTKPAPHVTAARIIRTPAEKLDVSFNWWISNGNAAADFGPREQAFKGRWQEDFRVMGGQLGTPEGDANKYYTLRNQEFDYDQAYTATILPTDTLWLYPGEDAKLFARGYDTRYLLSFGPFDINEGEVLPLSFAYMAGPNFHRSPDNFSAHMPDDPDAFYAGLNFDSLGANSRWASWLYDNPGVDTDGDGDFGEIFICVSDSALLDSTIDSIYPGNPPDTTWNYEYVALDADTCFITGDGVPDFKGAAPPPAPSSWSVDWPNPKTGALERTSAFRVVPQEGKVTVVFNGLRSETTRDAFSGDIDFEGYRVYLSRDNTEPSFSLVASFDKEDYNKYVWVDDLEPRPGFALLESPFSIDSLATLYGDDPRFNLANPTAHTPSSPYIPTAYPDSSFYFLPQDYNVSSFGMATPIEKVYPEAAPPSSLIPEEAQPDELTDEGFFKYYEYKLDIPNLQSTVDYWVNVTAFDFGSPASDLPSLESSIINGAINVYPQETVDSVLSKGLGVYVYPNPYRIDGKYKVNGYEDPATNKLSPEYQRRIHFANLPTTCTIRIFTLDGDLVQEIEHNLPASDPNAGHDSWDLTTRNRQQVVSGLYYWTVESTDGEVQIGKLVILM